MSEEAKSEYRIEPLGNHDRAAFSCGVEAHDNDFRVQVTQDVSRKIAAAFVLTSDSKQAVGFYTLSSLSVSGADLPDRLAKKLPSWNPIGVTLLGHMAVHLAFRGKGWGELLLMHALKRTLTASREVASFAVVVDPKEEARSFYLKY